MQLCGYRTAGFLVAASLWTSAGCLFPRAGTSGSSTSTSLQASASKPGTQRPSEIAASDAAKLRLAMAEDLEKHEHDEDAIAYYERARDTDPAVRDKAQRRLAVLYDKIDQQSKAMAEFQELLARHPKDADLLNDIGYSFYNRGQWTEAEKYLRQATERAPTNKRAWTNLGMTLAQQGRLEESYTAFSKAVPPADAYGSMAFLLAAQGKPDEARELYRKALEMDAAHGQARAGLDRLDKLKGEGSVIKAESVEP